MPPLFDANLSFGLSSLDSEEFTQQILGVSAEANGQRPFARQKNTRDASKLPEDEKEKPKTQVMEVPSELLSVQLWLARHITQPLSDSRAAHEPEEVIAVHSRLSAQRRLRIYQEQYWWRLLAVLHRNFPTLTRLFGYKDFDAAIGVPFLLAHPPTHWSIIEMGKELPLWIKTQCADPLVILSAQMDWAYQELFFAPPAQPLTSPLKILSSKVQLQRHVRLFEMPYDLFSFRITLLKQSVAFWCASDFPPLKGGQESFFILFRTAQNRTLYKEIEEGQWRLLSALDQGLTLEEACDELESSRGHLYGQAARSLDQWIKQWLQERWLCSLSTPSKPSPL